MALPADPQEAHLQLWAHLKTRLRVREAAQVPLGVVAHLPIEYRRNGNPEHSSIECDVSIAGGGWATLAEITGIAQDELHGGPDEALPWVLDSASEFVRLGVLRTHASNSGWLFITRQGAEALRADEIGFPIANDARLDAFTNEFSDAPDHGLIRRHLGEAIAAYRANLDLSATVMIGCCYECALVQLVDAFQRLRGRTGRTLGLNASDTALLQRHTDGWYVPASNLERICTNAFTALRSSTPSLEPHREWMQGSFRPNLHLVRSLRNDAGHPTGNPVSREEAATHIAIFNGFFRRCRSLCGTLDAVS